MRKPESKVGSVKVARNGERSLNLRAVELSPLFERNADWVG